MNEALECAELLKQSNYKFDKAYTSLLTRAHQTLKIITAHIDRPTLPVEESWRLNERHYGALTGFNKAELAEEYGESQVLYYLLYSFYMVTYICNYHNFIKIFII